MSWYEYERERQPVGEDSNDGLGAALLALVGIPVSLFIALAALCY